MIPIRLKMSAFGPFKEPQAIDFTQFDSDKTFLISGDTGSGKTSIFDAITYSLYGVASGSLRQSDSFKSHFADESELCSVEFEFINKQKKYMVYREPAQDKLRRGGNISREQPTALLTFENGESISGVNAVNAEIQNILGLNSDQFKKIIMLPQGEFRKFLLDDADEKQKTLRNIFETEMLSSFSERLRVNAAEQKHEAENEILKANAYIKGIKAEENSELHKVTNAENIDFALLFELLSKSLDSNKKSVKQINMHVKEIEEKKKKQEYILSLFESKNKSEKLINEYKKSLLNNKNETSYQKAIYEQAKKDYENLGENAIKIRRLEDEMRIAEQAKILKKNLETAEKERNEKAEREKILQKLISLSALNLQIKEISGGLNARHEIIGRLDNLFALQKSFLKASDEYKGFLERFISSQAFLIAGNLKENAPCPVCGSTDHPMPAVKTELTVTQAQIEEKRKIYEELSAKTESFKAACRQELISMGYDGDFNTLVSEIAVDIDRLSGELEQKQKLYQEYDVSLQKQLNAQEVSIDEYAAELEEVRISMAVFNEKLNNLSKEIEALAIPQKTLEEIKKQIAEIKANGEKIKESFEKSQEQLNKLVGEASSFEKSVEGQEKVLREINAELSREGEVSPDGILALLDEIERELSLNNNTLTQLSVSYSANKSAYDNLKETVSKYEEASRKYGVYNRLYEIANGKYSGRVNFERYILSAYFDEILQNSNIRLEQMTNSRYTLKRRTEREKGSKPSGLVLEVFDAYTGRARHVNTLSGGEIFKLSLCLALGLADIISQNAGGIELNTLFIDEGFGLLDSNSLNSAIDCLETLKANGRYIGIISHVAELKEKIPQRIIVEKGIEGSFLR